MRLERSAVYWLTVNHSTWHINQDLLLSIAPANASLLVPVYYTVGYCKESPPLQLALREGANTLTFFRSTDRPIALKEFFLYETEPHIPPPPANYTPAPSPPRDAYIELPAATTCARQGIGTIADAAECGRACVILGFKYTGVKPRANMTGCFALTDGAWKGNCNYNTNKSAVCAEPPCTVEGSTGQALCIRK